MLIPVIKDILSGILVILEVILKQTYDVICFYLEIFKRFYDDELPKLLKSFFKECDILKERIISEYKALDFKEIWRSMDPETQDHFFDALNFLIYLCIFLPIALYIYLKSPLVRDCVAILNGEEPDEYYRMHNIVNNSNFARAARAAKAANSTEQQDASTKNKDSQMHSLQFDSVSSVKKLDIDEHHNPTRPVTRSDYY